MAIAKYMEKVNTMSDISLDSEIRRDLFKTLKPTLTVQITGISSDVSIGDLYSFTNNKPVQAIETFAHKTNNRKLDASWNKKIGARIVF